MSNVYCDLKNGLENKKPLTEELFWCGKIEVKSISDNDLCDNGKHLIKININYEECLKERKIKVIFDGGIIFDCEKITEAKNNIEGSYEKYIDGVSSITFNRVKYYYLS